MMSQVTRRQVLTAGVVSGVGVLTSASRSETQEKAKADKEAAKKFVGKWKGTMKSPENEDFPVEIEITEFMFGKWCGNLKHVAPLDADGKLLGVKVEGKTMFLAQTVFRGRERCLDGMNMLTLTDDNTLERVWVDPETGKARDKGTLKRSGRRSK
jgi:hypothetical protein